MNVLSALIPSSESLLLRDPVADVGDSVFRKIRRRAIRKAGRERVALSGLGRVHAKLEES
jgi:hypothetical protein